MKKLEYDDLFQEGAMALQRTLCGREEESEVKIKKYLIRNMRGIIRDIADRMNGNLKKEIPLDMTEEENREEPYPAAVGNTQNSSFAVLETELFAKLNRLLAAEEYRLAELKYAGASNRDIARMLGISHTTVAAKLKKLGEKVKNALSD